MARQMGTVIKNTLVYIKNGEPRRIRRFMPQNRAAREENKSGDVTKKRGEGFGGVIPVCIYWYYPQLVFSRLFGTRRRGK